MRWFSLQVAVLSCIVAAWAQPLSFFKPVVDLGADDIERIRSGRVVTQTIHGSSNDLGVLAAGSLKTTPDAFISRVTDIGQLRKSRMVPAIGRFSNPPMIDDLAALTLSAEDVNDLSECRAGDCGLKLADAEIRRMQAALATGKVNAARLSSGRFERFSSNACGRTWTVGFALYHLFTTRIGRLMLRKHSGGLSSDPCTLIVCRRSRLQSGRSASR